MDSHRRGLGSPFFEKATECHALSTIAVLVLLALACNPRGARAFPWSIDMFRGDAMQPMAEAPRVMPADTLPTNGERARSTAASRRLQNPLVAGPKDIEEGEKLYLVYCSVCHGPGGRGDGPVRFMLREHRPPTSPRTGSCS